MKAATLFFLLLLCPFLPLAQEADAPANALEEYQQNYNQAIKNIVSSRYAQGIVSLNKAIEIAKANDLTKEYLQANIELGETMRKTGDFKRGVEILLDLGEYPQYPLQEVRKYGRLAAIYHEYIKDAPKAQFDSVTKYLNPAIQLASENNFQLELAGLKNEYGYLVSRYRSWQEGLSYHQEAAQIYYENGEKHNYVGVMTKVLTLLSQNTQDYKKIDSLTTILCAEVEGKNWHSAETELYGSIANRYALQNKMAEHYKWEARSTESMLAYERAIKSRQLDDLRVSYETQKFQAEAEENAALLNRQQARNRELIIYLSFVGLLMIIIGYLFYRERKTKRVIDHINKDLKTANENYQVLMVESNHRIKNNLQMIISMLEYAGKDVNPENTRALKRMSGKIHTISALHKHLYTDVHNPRVGLATYFKEIITLYTDLTKESFEVHEDITEVNIESERLVYFGLIFNEMLSNTMEHNKADLKQVYVSTSKHDEGYHFEYRDDSAYTNQGNEGTGMLLIRQLINRIGGQNLEFDPLVGQYKFHFYV